MRTIPVYLVLVESLGLRGVHYVAFRDYTDYIRMRSVSSANLNGLRSDADSRAVNLGRKKYRGSNNVGTTVLLSLGVTALLITAVASSFLLGRTLRGNK